MRASAPTFDLKPTPVDVRERRLTTPVDHDDARAALRF
jgi:hypothetical protein